MTDTNINPVTGLPVEEGAAPAVAPEATEEAAPAAGEVA